MYFNFKSRISEQYGLPIKGFQHTNNMLLLSHPTQKDNMIT